MGRTSSKYYLTEWVFHMDTLSTTEFLELMRFVEEQYHTVDDIKLIFILPLTISTFSFPTALSSLSFPTAPPSLSFPTALSSLSFPTALSSLSFPTAHASPSKLVATKRFKGFEGPPGKESERNKDSYCPKSDYWRVIKPLHNKQNCTVEHKEGS